MIALPSLPSWPGFHPLVVHFPIALLLIAPLLVIVGALLPSQKGRVVLFTALGLMTLGTVGTIVAAASGEAASALVNKTSQVKAVLQLHEELADITRGVFSFLTAIFAAIVIAPTVFPKLSNRVIATTLPLVFLLLYSVGVVLLVNTASNGGRLVHEFGVRAVLGSSTATAAGGTEIQGMQAAEAD